MAIICPKCHHSRSAKDDPSVPDYQCPACGIIYSKFNRLSTPQKNKPSQSIKTQPFFNQEIDQKKLVLMSIIFCVVIFSAIGLIEPKDNTKPEEITVQQTEQEKISDKKAAYTPIENIKRTASPAPAPVPIMPATPSIQMLNGIFSVEDIQASYEANSVRADSDFKNKRIKLTGTIDDINTDLFGNPYLSMRNPKNLFARPQLKFDKSSISILKSFDKGRYVMLVCTGSGDVLKTAIFTDCQLP
jgi:hypothetical protein